jgi:ribonuclease Z
MKEVLSTISKRFTRFKRPEYQSIIKNRLSASVNNDQPPNTEKADAKIAQRILTELEKCKNAHRPVDQSSDSNCQLPLTDKQQSSVKAFPKLPSTEPKRLYRHKAVDNISNRVKSAARNRKYYHYTRSGFINRVPTFPKDDNYTIPSMKCSVQFLTTPTADTPGTTLVLNFDLKRYVIGNVAEGTQRACVQRKTGMMKISDIFLTGTVGWQTTGGILGMVLTIADSISSSAAAILEDSKKKKNNNNRPNQSNKRLSLIDQSADKRSLNIHGGKNLTHFVATARRFLFRHGMPVYTQEFRADDTPSQNWEPTWQDEIVKVWAMVIESKPAQNLRKRSHEETFSQTAEDLARSREKRKKQEEQDDLTRRDVVAHMFDSDWRLDTLVKTTLSELGTTHGAAFFRDETGKLEKYHGPRITGPNSDVPDIDVFVRNPWPASRIPSLPSTTPSTTSVCYIIKSHPVRGKFKPQTAKELGVKPGRDFQRLSNGESITLDNGTIITPNQVMEPSRGSPGFAVIELPVTSFVEPLLCREEWSSKEVMEGVASVIWILGPGVVDDARLQKFMKDHTEWQHIVSSKDVCPDMLALESPASAAIRLNLLDRERFPIPAHDNSLRQSQSSEPLPYQIARTDKVIQLSPSVEIQDDKIVPFLDTEEVVKDFPADVLKLAQIAQKEVANDEYLSALEVAQQHICCKDAEVITLGTGSALPSKYRNVSATLVRVPELGSYLFDCGENTLGQLKRVFGDKLPEVLQDLKLIWISHLHADHHLGTVSVIRAWNEETKSTQDRKLLVAAEPDMIKFLNEYSEVESYGHDRLERITMETSDRINPKWHDVVFSPNKTNLYGISNIIACRVDHCHNAMAVRFNFVNGFSVAYSGDCRPSERFKDIGRDVTLLIHEATFDDELQGDAKAKKHSTTSEALEVGSHMRAKRILLTHFSQRYQKIPVMENENAESQIAIVAFDYMRVKLGDFAKLSKFKPALVKLYEGEEGVKEVEKDEEDQDKGDKTKKTKRNKE